MDYKKRVLDAMTRHHESLLPKKQRRKKKNDSPEAEVVLAIKNHFNDLGWSLKIIESKAVYNEKAGRYISQQAESGTSDLVGNTPDGIAAFIEVKAKGKLSTLRPDQRNFLIEKISTNCFAIVADSVERVESLYQKWQQSQTKKAVLLKALPEMTKKQKRFYDADFDL